ncbi:MAG: helix-turn-helix domain-containing protein [Actinomycetota bacterium]
MTDQPGSGIGTGPAAGTDGPQRHRAVPLAELREGLILSADADRFAANPVLRVRAARELADIEEAEPGDLVVLDSTIHEDVAGYRFDLAVARANPGVAAIIGGEPGRTGRRVAAAAGIALGAVAPGYDVPSLAVLLRDLSRGRQQSEVALLERLVDAAAACVDTADIDRLLTEAGRALGGPVHLERTAPVGPVRPIRVQGMIRWYLVVEPAGDGAREGAGGGRSTGDFDSPLVDSALSHVARRIEALLQADYEARELPEATRSELINELLLSDAGTSADAAGRLRQAGFPLDGSHCAIRIDCRSVAVGDARPEAAVATFQAQQRVAQLVLEGARQAGGMWTRAGTATSIVLVSSRTTPQAELVNREVGEAATLAVNQAGPMLDGLVLHVGVGTPHLGVGGLRTTVNEATAAVRAARDRGRPNEPNHFDRLGFSRALLQWAEIDGVRAVVGEILGPLLDQPPDRARESIETLRIYLATGRSVSATAAALHLHRNTVRYRVDRIRSRLPVDLDDPDERLLVELGCRLIAGEPSN